MFAVLTKRILPLLEALKLAETHLDELADAWQRGALHGYDGQDGIRSNRNMDILIAIRKAAALSKQAGGTK